nr:hypothetical protein [Pseudomonas syringae pv. actinidiae]
MRLVELKRKMPPVSVSTGAGGPWALTYRPDDRRIHPTRYRG